MLGIGFIKAPPTTYLIQYRNGRIVREGVGLSFFYFSPTASLVAVPVGSRDEGFIFELNSHDFQGVTVQGQVGFRVAKPRQLATMLNFALQPGSMSYESDDPQQIKERVLALVKVLAQKTVQSLALKDALRAGDAIAAEVQAGLAAHGEIAALGIEVLGVSVLSVKPTPETARALEAEAREAILRSSDEAIFVRRNAAVEQERAIRQNELDTEVAVEEKKRLIRETQMEAEASVRRKKNELRQAEMEADITLEERRKEWVARNAENSRTLAEAEAFRVASVMQALEKADPRIVQSLAAAGMDPGQLIAQAFGGIAERAEKIGQLNMSPELLQSLLAPPLPPALPTLPTPSAPEKSRAAPR